jgi:hypothetical protein
MKTIVFVTAIAMSTQMVASTPFDPNGMNQVSAAVQNPNGTIREDAPLPKELARPPLAPNLGKPVNPDVHPRGGEPPPRTMILRR